MNSSSDEQRGAEPAPDTNPTACNGAANGSPQSNGETIRVHLPQQIPLAHRADVLVIGGGPGGIGAAVAAAREGADVILVEHYGFLGGMATAGEVNPFMPNFLDGRSLDTGIFEDWLERMAHYRGIKSHARVFDPNLARLAAEDLCIDAKVRLLYHHRAIHVETVGRHIDAVVLHSKSGLAGAKAKCYIDSTGDGDVAALAGCEFYYGNEQTHDAQPMTLCFKLKIDPQDIPEGPELAADPFAVVKSHLEEINTAYHRAQKDGRIECPRENVLIFPSVERGVIHFNTTRVVLKSSINGQQLSEAEIVARRQLRQIWQTLRDEVPLFRHSKLYSIAPQIGIRESRRIVGRAFVTIDDFQAARTFPDGIARVTYPIDIHCPTGTGTQITQLPKGAWYEVPWRSLLPRDLDNLAVGSRCISADHATHSSLRVMPPVCSLGQAAGTAAAMAVESQTDISSVDGSALKTRLIERGRNLVYDSSAIPASV